jgi:hypothetical protein
MKTTLALAITTALAIAHSRVGAEQLAGGLEFHPPTGWTMKASGQSAALTPPDPVTELGSPDPSEIYLLGMNENVRNVRDPQSVAAAMKQYFPAEARLQPAAAPQPFQAVGGNGYVYRFDAVSQGIPVRLHLYVVELRSGGTAGLVAVARPALMERREPALAAIAATLSHPAATATATRPSTPAVPAPTSAAVAHGSSGPLAAQWDQRLRGRKLYQFSSYSSGYGSGGYNSQKTLLLGVNGIYEFHRAGSVSVYVDGASGGSASQNGDQGRWRIYEQNGKVYLELVSAKSGTETIELTSNGTKTLLNGNRWLVGD